MTDDQLTVIMRTIILATALPPNPSVPIDLKLAAVHLTSSSDGSRRTIRTALNMIAQLLHVGKVLDGEERVPSNSRTLEPRVWHKGIRRAERTQDNRS
jgi:hypothetical protein